MTADLDKLDALARLRTVIDRPAGRGKYVEHVLDEGHDLDAPCALCDLVAAARERDKLRMTLERIAYWEGHATPPHDEREFDDWHFDCDPTCPAMVARAALNREVGT